MNLKIVRILTTVAVAFAGSVIAQAQAVTAKPDQAKLTVAELAWMAGCWEMKDEVLGRTVLEQWMKPAGGLMLGMSRTTVKDKANAWEFMRLEEREGKVHFVARPSQNTSDTAFALVRFGLDEAVFESPEHDFPQRVIYRRRGEFLTGRIEGTVNGKDRSIDFPMKRLACE